MPANPGDVDQVNLTAIGEFGWWLQLDVEFFIKILIPDLLPELVQIINRNPHHQILCKGFVIKILKDKRTGISPKTDIVICFPTDIKSDLQE